MSSNVNIWSHNMFDEPNLEEIRESNESMSLMAERVVPGTGDEGTEVFARVENLMVELTRLMDTGEFTQIQNNPSFQNSANMVNLIQRLNDTSGGFMNRSSLPPVAESSNRPTFQGNFNNVSAEN